MMMTGWICPRCNAAVAPWCSTCPKCEGQPVVVIQPWWPISPAVEPWQP